MPSYHSCLVFESYLLLLNFPKHTQNQDQNYCLLESYDTRYLVPVLNRRTSYSKDFWAGGREGGRQKKRTNMDDFTKLAMAACAGAATALIATRAQIQPDQCAPRSGEQEAEAKKLQKRIKALENEVSSL